MRVIHISYRFYIVSYIKSVSEILRFERDVLLSSDSIQFYTRKNMSEISKLGRDIYRSYMKYWADIFKSFAKFLVCFVTKLMLCLVNWKLLSFFCKYTSYLCIYRWLFLWRYVSNLKSLSFYKNILGATL